MTASGRLLKFLTSFRFQPLAIHRAVDAKKRLPQAFDPDFPLIIRIYSFPAYREMLGENWENRHDHLEMILPIAGSGRFRSGEHLIDFTPGDLLLIDRLKLHGMIDLNSEHRSLVIYFLPELVYGLGSCKCDAAFLAAFFERSETTVPILRKSDVIAPRVYEAIMKLVDAFFGSGSAEDQQAACKLHLLEILFSLRRHFELQDTVSGGYAQQRRRTERLRRLFDFLNANYSQKILLSDAATMVGMSKTSFKNFFKRTTGSSFAQYVIHVRLAYAAQLLRDTDFSMAKVAQQTGFCDQSHFDNRFKSDFHLHPTEYRVRHRGKPEAASVRFSK